MVSPWEIASKSTSFFFIFSRSCWTKNRSPSDVGFFGSSLSEILSCVFHLPRRRNRVSRHHHHHLQSNSLRFWLTTLSTPAGPDKFHSHHHNNRICTSISEFPQGRRRSFCSSGNTNNSDDDEKAKKALEKLQFIDTIHINQTRRLSPGNLVADQSMSLLQFEVRCKEDTKLYDVEYNRAQNPEEFYIKVYPNNEGDCLVATMQLEPEVQLKTLILRIYAPPGNLIGSVFEVKGISRILLVVDDKDKTLFQLLTDGGFGWTTVAKILNARGETKVGQMHKTNSGHHQCHDLLSSTKSFKTNHHLQTVAVSSARPELQFTVCFYEELNVLGKMSLLGACIVLMKDY